MQQARSAGNAAAKPDGKWRFFGSWRVRPEFWDWFPSTAADNEYLYVGSTLRIGFRRQTTRDETVLELEQPTLINLPTQAIAPPPQGQLGLGAAYRAANGGQVASAFLKQGFVRFRGWAGKSNSLKLGRFEFADGAELPSTDPTLSYLKRERVSQRLIGPFGFTHVGRSLDGFQFSSDTPGRNSTFLFAFPTRGVFSLRGMDTLTDVRVVYLATSQERVQKQSASDLRLFGIYYQDSRDQAIKTDTRPLPVRAADRLGIDILTFGGHYLRTMSPGKGKVDLMIWGAGQFGRWGALKHGGTAYAAEVGYQPQDSGWKPWLRLGYYNASGDGNPANNQHGAFFPIMPTPRIYARFPFFSENNLQDAFFQALLRPNPRLTVRLDAHNLTLAEKNDFWYVGGGAFENNSFGYIGRPTAGFGHLANLFDLSIDYQLHSQTTLTLYMGYAQGGNAMRTIYGGRDAAFGYVEMMHRF
jgi:hypothetical protein